jgi:hypothetical protein
LFEVLWKAKQNDDRVGNEKTILDENRHITFYEDYTDGQSPTCGVLPSMSEIDL